MIMSTKRKVTANLATPVVRPSARVPSKATIDETRASIAGTDALQPSQVETIEISSDENSDDDISDADNSGAEDGNAQELVNGSTDAATSRSKASRSRLNGKDAQSPAKHEDEADSDADAGPSFGELLRAENEIIDVPSLMNPVDASNSVSQPTRSAINPPSHQSLTTVLSQALRTDDIDLLESCLHTSDLPTIRNTIERLDSSLAGLLLTKLAARLYRRPGRAGNLMTWVQWTLIAHGGALASQPKVIHSLNGLQKVLAERAKGLNSLLALKGKLDMLEGQMDLRRKMSRGPGLSHAADSDESEDEDVIWVEGEDDRALTRRRNLDDDFDDDEDDDDVPITNGFVGDSDDEEDSAGEEDNSGAEESLDEDEVNHDDVDESMGEDEESDVEAPPAKLQKTGGKRR
ncbi:Dip2/Utp12 family-domain-containing protein [Dactylonectria estremocensis]|uniref:Dip2/Utp12 family-domain-containing protein n=1 Tax=Dactylonectria estremocensis TaxID=1079267 RepID=A0A9P9J724_9HYPO|nr:Dip2/Utp12 family-domain-containing protein [Dactylonectria estremocensis]